MPQDLEIIEGSSSKEVKLNAAHNFIKLVESGVEPGTAAALQGIPLAILERQEAVRRWKERLAPYDITNPGEHKRLINANLTRILAEGEDKDQVAAARALQKDPALGYIQQQGGVQINISDETRSIKVPKIWDSEGEEDRND